MKKIKNQIQAILCVLSLVSIFVLFINITCFADSDNNKITVTVNSQEIEFDQEPINVGGRILVPLRKICDAIGAEIYYDNTLGIDIIKVLKNNSVIFMTKGWISYQNYESGKWRICKYILDTNKYDYMYPDTYYAPEMEVEPVILNGRICVPIRVLTEYLGSDVNWIDSTKTVEISINNIKFDRSYEMRLKSEQFTEEQSNAIFLSLPETRDYLLNGMDYLCYGTEVFTKKGRSFYYNIMDETGYEPKYEIFIYADRCVDYVDCNTKQLVKTIQG